MTSAADMRTLEELTDGPGGVPNERICAPIYVYKGDLPAPSLSQYRRPSGGLCYYMD